MLHKIKITPLARRLHLSPQFLTFLVTGGCGAATNFFSRIAYSHWMSFSSAIIVAYCTGMVVAFTLAKMFVFKTSSRKLHHSILFFILVNIAGAAQVWAITTLMASYVLPWLGVTILVEEIAHAVGIVVPTFTSYLGHKYLSFRE